MKDIEDIDDIKTFVNGFYAKVREDHLLSPVFATRIESDDWQRHLNRMYDFWNTILFFQRAYKGNAFSKHQDLPVDAAHFSQWIRLFKKTIDENFKGHRAEETKTRVEKMALLFQSKIAYLKENPQLRSIV